MFTRASTFPPGTDEYENISDTIIELVLKLKCRISMILILKKCTRVVYRYNRNFKNDKIRAKGRQTKGLVINLLTQIYL